MFYRQNSNLMRYNAKKVLTQLIQENRINDVFIVFSTIKKSNQDLQNTISQLSGQFNANEEKRRLETATNEFLKVEHNRIMYALLDVINGMDNKITVAVEYENTPETKPEPLAEPIFNFKWRYVFFGAIFISVIYFYFQTENFEKNLNTGQLLMQTGRYDEALSSFTKAIETSTSDDKNLHVAYAKRANAKIKLKYYQEAIDDCSKAIALNGNYKEAFIYRGNAYCKAKAWELAVKDLTKSIKLGTTDHTAYYWRGYAYFYQQDYQLAIPDFSEALKFNSDMVAEILNARGKAYDKNGQHDEACRDFDQSCKSGYKGSCEFWEKNCGN
jgi:tetratricopeptide (TPR) repeat protein